MTNTLSAHGRRARCAVVRHVSHVVHGDTERTRRLMWDTIYLVPTTLSLWLGVGYSIGGSGATTSPGWGVLTNRYVLGWAGGLRAHGVIMLTLGVLLLVETRGPRRRLMVWSLRLLRTYALIVCLTWFASWPIYGVSWGAPAWWAVLAALTIWLAYFDPYAAERARAAARPPQ